MKLSIVIPVYCGELTLKPLWSAIRKALDNKYDYEVIFVWDCGPDNSWNVICELKEESPDIIKAIKLSRNFGQHNAIICGIEFAEGDYVVTMDEDLQHNPEDIEKLIKKQKERDYDVVYGKYNEKKHFWWRNVTSKIMQYLLKKTMPELPSYYSPFRLIHIDTAKQLLNMHNSYTFLDGYLTWLTINYSKVDIVHHSRIAGESGYSVFRLIERSINVFVTFSNLPLRFIIFMSLGVFILTGIYSIYIFFRTMLYDDFQAGFPILIIILSAGIGLILFSIGVVGEYIFRINMKTTKRPNYNMKEKI